MIKRLLLLLCLTLTAGSAAWADIASGSCKNGSWVIDDSGKLTVNINGDMKDYGEGKAPWFEYWPQITAIHIGSKCTNIGRNGFYGLEYVEEVTGGENVEACAKFAFEQCGGGSIYENDKFIGHCRPIPQIYFPKCSYVGECAFSGCYALAISLPLVETWKVAAISGNWNDWGMYSSNIQSSHYGAGVDVVDLGSKTEFLRPGSILCPDYVFCQNPTPPDWSRLYDRDEGDYSLYWFAKILTFGQIGSYEGRDYEYPFGDNSSMKFIVPQEYLQTYKNFYPKNHPEVEPGYMCAGYEDDHSKNGKTFSTGKLVAGAPIYKDGKLLGGWYKDGSELHVIWMTNEMPVYDNTTAPWKSVLGSVTEMYVRCLSSTKGFTIPANCFKDGRGISGISEIHFETNNEQKNITIGGNAFENCTNLTYLRLSYLETKYSKIIERSHVTAAGNAFSGCTKLKYIYGTFMEINRRTFYNCKALSTVDLFYNDSDIPEECFYGCEALESYNLSRFHRIGKRAFANSGLREVNLSTCQKISEQAFANCKKLGNLTMPVVGFTDGDWESKAFMGCTSLKDVFVSHWITSSLTPLDFFQGVDLKTVTLHARPELYGSYYENIPLWKEMHVDKEFTFPVGDGDANTLYHWELSEAGTLTIGGSLPLYWTYTERQPWYNYREFVKNVVIESGAEHVGHYNFAGLKNLQSVSLPRSVKAIYDSAFKGCSSLTDIYITGVEELGDNVFEGCSSLEYIDLGMGLKKAGDYIFKNCTSLETIGNKDNTPAEVSKYTFADIGSQAYQLRGGRQKAAGGQAAVTLEVPDEFVTNYIIDPDWGKFHIRFADSRGTWQHAGPFGDGTWILYDDGTMVVAADKGPGDGADNWKWSELRFDSEVVKNTKRIEISGNIPYLANCFANFENLESVSLSPSIKTLGELCFDGCVKLSDINLDNVVTLGQAALSATGLTAIDLSKVKSVGRYAFDNCQNLKIAKLGSQCAVGKDVFNHCSALTAVDLGDVNLDAADRCFSSCSSLEFVAYNGQNLPHNIFYNCTALKSVKLGPSLRSIYWDAFEGCTALNTVYCDSPTPPTLPKGVTQDIIGWDSGVVPIYGPEYDVWAFNGLTLSNISLFVPENVITSYRKAIVWKDMNIQGGEDDAEPLLPAGGSLGSNGTWYLDEDGTLVIDASGDIQAFDSKGKPWSDTFNSWAGLIKTVVVADGVTSIPDNFFGGEYFSDISAGIETVKLGRFLKSVGKNSLSFSGIKDVYVYSAALLELESNTFDLTAAVRNGATLHVLQASDNRYRSYYLSNSATSRFPYIVADLDGQQTIASGTLGTKGYWTFADGVLTVTYNGAMPTITKSVTDPEQAFRYKWIDFLGQIEEVVVTGNDVEIQPYFLYYEGTGTSDGQHPDDHIKTVTLGAGVKSLGRGSLSLYEMNRLNCYSIDAPTLPTPNKAFWTSRITTNRAFLWTVPNASTGYAMINSEWANFNHSAHKLNPEASPKQEGLVNFETGKLNQVAFTNDAQYPWDVTLEDASAGSYSMKSGNKGVASSSSAITAYFLYETDGVISFDAKFMGEGSGSGWDKCLFYIDGEQQFSYGACGNRWYVGNTFPVSAGMHTFKWEYTKDSSVDAEGDAFFVDNIYFLQEGKDDDMIDGVEEIDHSPLTIDHWFDLSGRQIVNGKLSNGKLPRGIYINGGKKVVIK